MRCTQEVYALEFTGAPPGPVAVLGVFPSDPDAGPLDVYYRGLDAHLDGWPERCESPGGLVWARDRLAFPPDPDGPTHLVGWRDSGGHENALCGDQAGLSYFLRHLREQQDRAVTCRECVDIQNLLLRGKRRDTRASSRHLCRACGQLLGRWEDPTWGITQSHPGVSPVVNPETVWVCRNCWRDWLETLWLPDPEEVRRAFEPGCPTSAARLKAVAALEQAGLQTCVTMTPLLTVRDVDAFAASLLATGCRRFISQSFHFEKGEFVAQTRETAFRAMADRLGCGIGRVPAALPGALRDRAGPAAGAAAPAGRGPGRVPAPVLGDWQNPKSPQKPF